ncbi:uncharacterized protein LOC134810568 isoform X2 [Pan troglodytes]|uniref:uncharacterized protein LOC134810568 isoform X2 n=1 Tax=Pan troglodytes TaxID=9598 RepID=UPI0030141418
MRPRRKEKAHLESATQWTSREEDASRMWLPCKTCLSASTMIVRSLQPHVTEGVAIIHAIVKTSWQQNFQDWNCKDDYKGELHNQVFQDNEYFHSNKSLTINGYLDFHIFKEKSLNGN